MTSEEQEKVLDELRWYGHMIAGGGPIGGYAKVAKEAEKRWYKVTLPLLYDLGEVYKKEKES